MAASRLSTRIARTTAAAVFVLGAAGAASAQAAAFPTVDCQATSPTTSQCGTSALRLAAQASDDVHLVCPESQVNASRLYFAGQIRGLALTGPFNNGPHDGGRFYVKVTNSGDQSADFRIGYACER